MIFKINRSLVKGFSSETKVLSWNDSGMSTDDYRFCIIRVVPDGSIDFDITAEVNGDDYVIDSYASVTESKLIKLNCYGFESVTVNVTGTADVYVGGVDYE